MLCRICACMLRGGTGQQWNGTYDLSFKHHRSTETLRRSREAGCSICVALANELRSEIDLLDDQDISIEATLSELRDGQWKGDVYRLDFVLEKKRTRTFVLRPTDDEELWLRTPKSDHTSSDEVFELAHSWISRCRCATSWDDVSDKRYPKRLLDLEDLRSATGLKHGENLTFQSKNANLERTKIRLRENGEDDFAALRAKPNNRFVTLSHCWGKPRSVQGQLKLTSKTEEKFRRDGIELRAFSKTFRDVILFACRLPRVGYIWIDSLCIKQLSADPEEDPRDAEEDWLEQSRVMDRIYRESWLNISATAAVDGDKGLFYPRRPEYLWEDEISLNLVGLPGFHQRSQRRAPAAGPLQRSATGSDIPLRGAANSSDGRRGKDYLKRCTVIDVSFWDDLVDQAPVNQRAWVLQERLMSPRVLHFCANQIAWECSEFDNAEGHPEGVPTFKVKLGDIVDEGRLKGLDEEDGKRLREIRLKGFPDPDDSLPNLYVHELWKRIVEVYSRTRLTMSRDRLIALSGIARLFSNKWFSNPPSRYVAGMWEQYLESQLLWRVEPVFRDGAFENHATRDPTRAPSFSWAALDVPQGVVYGEATDYGDGRDTQLLFRVTGISIDLSSPLNEFGLIEKGYGYLQLEVQHLRRIKLRRLELPRKVPYGWRLAKGDKSREHTNVYLDAPESDVDIFSERTRIYCLPAAWGDRTVKESSRYLMCLLLKELDDKRGGCRVFNRVGLTKLSNHANRDGQLEVLRQEKKKRETIFIM